MKYRIAVVLGSFHMTESKSMLGVVQDYARQSDIDISEEIWVPGSLEKPLVLKNVLSKSEIDGAVALGIIERGETKHGLVMGEQVLKSILDIQLELMKPIGVGILGPEIYPSQIPARVQPYALKAIAAVKSQLDYLNSNPG